MVGGAGLGVPVLGTEIPYRLVRDGTGTGQCEHYPGRAWARSEGT